MYVLPWGQIGLRSCYTSNYAFLTPKLKGEHRIGPHDQDIYSIIIGSLLGDAYAERREFSIKESKIKNLGNTRISFHQSDKNVEYLMWLWKKFSKSGYTSNKKPKINKIIGKKNEMYYSIKFRTWTFSSFNWIHELFYQDNKKRVPKNIKNYLTPLALAVWIMNDGGWDASGLLIFQKFQYQDVETLKQALESQYQLKVSIRKKYENQWILYIDKESMSRLNGIIRVHMCPSMLRKLHLENQDS